MQRLRTMNLALALAVCATTASLAAQDAPVAVAKAAPTGFSKSQQRGIDFLLKNQKDGQFFMAMRGRKIIDVGLTGLALAAVQSKPRELRTPAEQKVIDSGIQWLLANQSKSGAFGQRTIVYATSSVIFALSLAAREADAKLRPQLLKSMKRARKLLEALQNTEGREYSAGDVDYGSYGYGNDERGDLSNTNFALDAMRQAGLPEGDEAFAKAIVFLQRLQNLPAVNTFKTTTKDPKSGAEVKVVPGSDGGATYYPGKSPAGTQKLADGSIAPRSYGSMTYALLKTYTLCGIDKDDPRVRAAVDWVARNWSVDVNPGADPKLGEKAQYQGLFYYYMVMAQALELAGIDRLPRPAGAAAKGAKNAKNAKAGADGIDWRASLRVKLRELQAPDGSWRNTRNDRWYEGLDVIASAYALLALAHCGGS